MRKMNNKRAIIGLCTVISTVAAFIISHYTASMRAQVDNLQPQQQTLQVSSEITEHAIYNHLFNVIVAFKEQAGKKNQPSLNSVMQRLARLSDEQAQILDSITSSCNQEVMQQDVRAKKIIDDFRSRYPGGKIPLGEKLPPIPAELKAMQEERNAIVLRARDQLRAAFGEQEFHRFDNFVKRHINALPPA